MKKGLNAQFYCKSHTKPTWIRDGLDKPYNTYTNDNYRFTNNGRNIHILYVTQLDIGYFECIGTIRNGDRFFARALLQFIGKCNLFSYIVPLVVTIILVVPFYFKSVIQCYEIILYS